MDKEEIIFWLKHFAEHPTGFKGYEDGEWKREINLYSVFNYLLELKCKVNQLETNRDEAIELLSKGVAFCENDSQGAYDVCNNAINREKKAIEILERDEE